MNSILDISTSGLAAQRARLNAISSNLANMSTTRNEAGELRPYQPKFVVFQADEDLRTPEGAMGVEVSSVELRDAIAQPVNTIVELVKTSIEETPPELVADIMEQGITLAGGGALLLGLEKRLQTELKMPVYRADDPLTCVARGTGRVAEALHLYERALASGSELRRSG